VNKGYQNLKMFAIVDLNEHKVQSMGCFIRIIINIASIHTVGERVFVFGFTTTTGEFYAW
jgi:hypothetical protein